MRLTRVFGVQRVVRDSYSWLLGNEGRDERIEATGFKVYGQV